MLVLRVYLHHLVRTPCSLALFPANNGKTYRTKHISLLYVTYNNVTKCVRNDGGRQGSDKSSFLEMDSDKGRPLIVF